MLAVMRIAIKSSELASRVVFFFIRCRSRLFLRSLRYHLASVSSTALQERFVFTTKINIIIEKRKKSTRKNNIIKLPYEVRRLQERMCDRLYVAITQPSNRILNIVPIISFTPPTDCCLNTSDNLGHTHF